jgi:hypothetical protein
MEFSRQFYSKTTQAELFLADRRTDMTELTVTFRNSAIAPKNGHEMETVVTYTTVGDKGHGLISTENRKPRHSIR